VELYVKVDRAGWVLHCSLVIDIQSVVFFVS